MINHFFNKGKKTDYQNNAYKVAELELENERLRKKVSTALSVMMSAECLDKDYPTHADDLEFFKKKARFALNELIAD